MTYTEQEVRTLSVQLSRNYFLAQYGDVDGPSTEYQRRNLLATKNQTGFTFYDAVPT